MLRDKILTQEEDLGLFLELVAGQPIKKEDEDDVERVIPKPANFLTSAELEIQLKNRHIIEFGSRPSWHSTIEIEFHTRTQPSFNRQFDMLIRDFKQWEKKG